MIALESVLEWTQLICLAIAVALRKPENKAHCSGMLF